MDYLGLLLYNWAHNIFFVFLGGWLYYNGIHGHMTICDVQGGYRLKKYTLLQLGYGQMLIGQDTD